MIVDIGTIIPVEEEVVEEKKVPFVVSNETLKSLFGAWVFPFLEGYTWKMLKMKQPDGEYMDSVADATLSWVGDGQFTSLYVYKQDGCAMTQDEYLNLIGVGVRVSKSAFVTSKRISRLWRPYLYHERRSGVKVLVDETMDKALYDGAGRVSREYVTSLLSHIPGMSKKDIQAISRIEFTILNNCGEYKGHAYVFDDLDGYDFIVPSDAKTDVYMIHADDTFVGVQLPHYADTMKIDIQSLVNLREFVAPILQVSMKEYISRFKTAVEAGDIANQLATGYKSGKENWAVMEYLASGGSMWDSKYIVRSIVAGKIKELLQNATQDKFRLPVRNAGRAYIFCDIVGGKEVKSGYARIEDSLFVSSEDYKRIIKILGGADQDDGCWFICYTNQDGLMKIIIWRSPNQLGEYIVLLADEHTQATQCFDSVLDENNLPVRIDMQQTKYLKGLIKPVKTVKGEPFSTEMCIDAIQKTKQNAGCLGAYCNYLLWNQAVLGKLPAVLPSLLEEVIDSTVKTGDNLAKIQAWLRREKARIIKMEIKTPSILKKRLGEKGLGLPTLTEHWIIDLQQMVSDTVSHLKEWRDELSEACQTHEQIISYAMDNPDCENTANFAIAAYNAIIQDAIKNGEEPDFELAQTTASDIVREDDNEMAVLAWIKLICQQDNKVDHIVWNHDKGQVWLELNRQLGIIEGLMQVGKKVQAYPYAQTIQTRKTASTEITFAWLHLIWRQNPEYAGMSPSEIYKENKNLVKTAKAKMSKIDLKNYVFHTKDGIAYNQRDISLGNCSNEDGVYQILSFKHSDGNISCIAVRINID